MNQLLAAASLQDVLRKELETDGAFALNWRVVQSWKVESRYERNEQEDATELFAAIADRKHGVLRWLKRHW